MGNIVKCWWKYYDSNAMILMISIMILAWYQTKHSLLLITGVLFFKCIPELFVVFVRMPQSWVPSSLAQRATATLFQRTTAGAPEEAGGTVASHCRLQIGSLCSCVSRSRSRRSGWRPSERSSLNPWPQRTTLVRYWPGTGQLITYYHHMQYIK